MTDPVGTLGCSKCSWKLTIYTGKSKKYAEDQLRKHYRWAYAKENEDRESDGNNSQSDLPRHGGEPSIQWSRSPRDVSEEAED